MPRQARKKSISGIYHIMLRGINRQIIFEDEEDNEMFLQIALKYKGETDCKIYGYCLMRNHAHIIIKTNSDNIGIFMRKLGAKYVYWYNWKYNRVGGLFQDRYKSEPIENDEYFLTVLRYIHQNPVKAGLEESVEKYRWSSYNEYLKIKGNRITDTEFALSILPEEQFIKYTNELNNDKCLDIVDVFRINDDEAKKIIYKISKCRNALEFQTLETKLRDKYIKKLKEKHLSVKQIERLTGINRRTVLKI